MTTYEIAIIEYDADMDKIREACADLTKGIDQKEDVNPKYVGEAVRRINELGYSTDEDK